MPVPSDVLFLELQGHVPLARDVAERAPRGGHTADGGDRGQRALREGGRDDTSGHQVPVLLRKGLCGR